MPSPKLSHAVIFALIVCCVDAKYAKYRDLHNESCGSIFLSISALSRKILMNWYYSCDRLPSYLLMREEKGPNQHEIIEQIEVDTLYGSYESRVVWKDDFPGGWNKDDPNPLQNHGEPICTKYYILSFRFGVQEDVQCLVINPNWMAAFPRLRTRNLYVPGTHSSGAFRRLQHYDFYQQLVFGIRYMDVKVGIDKSQNSRRYYVNDVKSFSLPKELTKVMKFLQKAKEEVVILDFRGFFSFTDDKDHELLISYLVHFFRYLMAPSILSVMHKDGPTLMYLLFFNYRVIINYRHLNMTQKYAFLWNSIFVKDCNAKSATDYEKCLIENGGNHEHIQTLCSIFANLKTTNSLRLGHNINANLSRWLTTNNLQKEINIIAIDYFETSNVINDAIEANKKRKYEELSPNTRL